jgi:ankyrin repeat protein
MIINGESITYADNLPLCMATRVNNFEFIEYLLENGANPYARNNTPICNAAIHKDLKIIKYFELKGINIHINNQALAQARKFKNSKMVKYLEEQILLNDFIINYCDVH